MKPVFADTSYYIALLSEEDVYHQRAVALASNLLGRTLVTEYVLVELGNSTSEGQGFKRMSLKEAASNSAMPAVARSSATRTTG